ncbi:hypothetical protein B0H14DRAFT_2615945 [Mycena olivaceomarginata]|nr:hypothetical protein B0H14DRAFT_2615945 [Mycena olivaceomarginata]
MSDTGSRNKMEQSQRQQAVADFRVLVGFEEERAVGCVSEKAGGGGGGGGGITPWGHARCEVSERAMHCSSPHGPCEPSARMTGELGPSRTRSRAIVSRIRWFPGFTLTSFLRRKAVYTSPTIETDALLDMDDTLDTPRYDRSPPVAERVADPFCCRFHTTSRAGRTLPVPDADPADEAELIPTPPPPPLHTTHRLAKGDRSSLPLPERSSAFRCDHQAVPEALVVF